MKGQILINNQKQKRKRKHRLLLNFLQETLSHGSSHQEQLTNQQMDVSQEHPLLNRTPEECWDQTQQEQFTQGGQRYPQNNFLPGDCSQENHASLSSQKESSAMQANQVRHLNLML